ncbi:recombination protein F [Qipengyuania gaetbuli]|nr:recombination protein F [Qipengyuania gaetbuli]
MQGSIEMFDSENFGGRLFAAAASLMISAAFFATAIVNATPTGALA